MDKIAIIGLGYVGLPLAVEFAKAGFKVIGIDVNKKRVDAINSGFSYIEDVLQDVLRSVVSDGLLSTTTDYASVGDCKSIIICVPTPLKKTRDPDISYIIDASQSISNHIKRGTLIVLESTTYPGTTCEILLPIFEKRGYRVGQDFFLAFSPERVDPGNRLYNIANTPKVVGGVTEESTKRAKELYSKIVNKVVTVDSATTAEMVKLLENTFRIVNIGLINEIALLCDRMGIDVWEVIKGASSKPFGFMPFYPGPGIGGHCIPIDPLYLSWKAKDFNFTLRFIELADEINRRMPEHVVSLIIRALNSVKKSLKGSNVLLIGVAYKKDVSDIRESPALDVLDHLIRWEAEISYFDPFVPQFEFLNKTYRSVELTRERLTDSDVCVIITDHTKIDWDFIYENSNLIVDTRGVYKKKTDKIIKL